MARRLVALLGLCVLASCAVNTTPPLEATVAPDAKLGYVAATFGGTGSTTVRFALRIEGGEGSSFHFALGAQSGSFAQHQAGSFETRMVALPPGVYRVGSFVMYLDSGRELKREEMSGGWFVVRPGHVVHLGRFSGETTVTNDGTTITTRANLRLFPVRADEVAAAIRVAYPRFESAPLECRDCSAPLEGAAAFAQPALTPEDARSQGLAVPEPAVVPAKAKARRSGKDEVEDRSVPEDRSGVW